MGLHDVVFGEKVAGVFVGGSRVVVIVLLGEGAIDVFDGAEFGGSFGLSPGYAHAEVAHAFVDIGIGVDGGEIVGVEGQFAVDAVVEGAPEEAVGDLLLDTVDNFGDNFCDAEVDGQFVYACSDDGLSFSVVVRGEFLEHRAQTIA